jgi:hypothetical protein
LIGPAQILVRLGRRAKDVLEHHPIAAAVSTPGGPHNNAVRGLEMRIDAPPARWNTSPNESRGRPARSVACLRIHYGPCV